MVMKYKKLFILLFWLLGCAKVQQVSIEKLPVITSSSVENDDLDLIDILIQDVDTNENIALTELPEMCEPFKAPIEIELEPELEPQPQPQSEPEVEFEPIPEIKKVEKSKPKLTAFYPIRKNLWTGCDGWWHLTQGEHSGKFDVDWLKSLSFEEIQSLHSDDHEDDVKWEYVIKPQPKIVELPENMYWKFVPATEFHKLPIGTLKQNGSKWNGKEWVFN